MTTQPFFRSRQRRAVDMYWACLLTFSFLLIAAASPAHASPFDKSVLLKFEDDNFQLLAPKGWKEIDPDQWGTGAQAGLLHLSPVVYTMVMADRYDQATNMTVDLLANHVMEETKLAGRAKRVWPIADERCGGIDGKRVELIVNVDGTDFYYNIWVGIHNGGTYRLFSWGGSRSVTGIRRETAELRRGFKLLDPNRILPLENDLPVTRFRRPNMGLTFQTQDKSWGLMPDGEETFDAAILTLQRGELTGLAVFALKSDDLNLSIPTLRNAFLQYFDLPIGYVRTRDVKTIDLLHATGIEFRIDRQIVENERDIFMFRIVQNGNFSYCIASWTINALGQTDHLKRAMDAVRIEPSKSGDWLTHVTNAQREGIAWLYGSLGETYEGEGRFDRAAPFYLAATNISQLDDTYLCAYARACDSNGNGEDALQALRAAGPDSSLSGDALAWRAYMEVNYGNKADGLKQYQLLFSLGYEDVDFLFHYLEELAETEQFTRAHQTLNALAGSNPSTRTELYKAYLYAQQDRGDEAIALLENAPELHLYNTRFAYALIEFYNQFEHYEKAIAKCDSLTAEGIDDAYVDQLKGEAFLNMGQYEEARKTFEIAAKKAPYNNLIHSYLQHARSLEGKGTNWHTDEPIEPVVLPQHLKTAMQQAAGESQQKLGEVPRRQSVTAIHYEKNKPIRKTTHLRIEIRDQADLDRAKELTVSFDGLAESIYLNELTITDQSGNVVATGKREDCYVLDDYTNSIVTDEQRLFIPVPGLKIGHVVYATYSVQQYFEADSFSYYNEYFFSRPAGQPTAVYITGDVEGIDTHADDAVTITRGNGYILAVCPTPPDFSYESWMADLSDFLPTVTFNPRNVQWRDEAEEYQRSIEHRLKPTAKIDALARSLVSTSDTPSQKLEKLSRYVQDALTYKAIAFGDRAIVPNAVDTIIANRFGDCKDHSLLLYHLLRAVQIESHLALVNTSESVNVAMPSMDQFDHMILYVPTIGNGLFVDCTRSSINATFSPPFGLAEEHAFILDPNSPRLEKLPAYRQNSCNIDLQRAIRIDEQGNAHVDESVKFSGYYASFMRSYFQNLQPHEQVTNLREYIDSGQHIQLQDHAITGLEEIDQPLTLSYQYMIRRAFHVSDNLIIGRLPAQVEAEVFDVEFLKKRITPFTIELTYNVKAVTEITAPTGFSFQSPNHPPKTGNTPFADWQMQLQHTSSKATYSQQGILRAGTYRADQYNAFYETMQSLLDDMRAEVRFVR